MVSFFINDEYCCFVLHWISKYFTIKQTVLFVICVKKRTVLLPGSARYLLDLSKHFPLLLHDFYKAPVLPHSILLQLPYH